MSVLDEETLAKLTTALAGDVELYNTILNEFQTKTEEVTAKTQELEETRQKLEEAEERGQQYLAQISNLLSKIPVGNVDAPLSIEQKIEEVKNREWKK